MTTTPPDTNQASSATITPSRGASPTTALYGILPAVGSTACCWGPPLISVLGGGGGAAALLSRRISQYRPLLLGLSATMIGYSLTQVYPEVFARNESNKCCHDTNSTTTTSTQQQHLKDSELQLQRTIVWASLAVAVAGASYGRVRLPQRVALPITSATTLLIDGMACQGCANKVQRAIQSVNGVHHVAVDHTTGQAVIQATSNNKMDHQAMRRAIEKAGFHVKKINE